MWNAFHSMQATWTTRGVILCNKHIILTLFKPRVIFKCHVLKTSLPLKSRGNNPHPILGVAVRGIIQGGPKYFVDYPVAQPIERDSRFFFGVTLDGLNERVTRSVQNLLSMWIAISGRVLIETAETDIFLLSEILVKRFACFLFRYFWTCKDTPSS